MTKFLRLPEVLIRGGFSRSTAYELIAAGKFPQPIKISKRAIAFAEDEIEAWQQARLAERDAAFAEDEIEDWAAERIAARDAA